MILGYTFAGLVALSAFVQAQDTTGSILDTVDSPFNFTECAAPAEIQACWGNSTLEQGDDDLCPKLESRIQCVLTNCWNRVYSCDYQRLMLSYETECFENFYKTDPALPFYPPPAEAAGQCACNLGNYLDAIRNVGFGALTCANETNANASQAASDCGCCFYGATFAAMDDICPDTNPQLLGLGDVDAIYIQGGDEADDNGDNIGLCVSRIGSSGNFSCANHGWDTYGTNASDYAKPTPVHSATGALTDLPGAITSPVSGATYTWTAFNGTYTITAASVEAVATRSVATTGSAKGSSTSDSAKTATGTAAVSSVASGAAAAVTGYVQGPVAAIAGLAGLAFALL